MIEITDTPISPDKIISAAKSDSCGCVVTYVGLIRSYSQSKAVLSVEYQDPERNAENTLRQIAWEAKQKWQIEDVAISHRVGKLKVGDINLVVAVASAHRNEGFAACQYIIDQFKKSLPTEKTETYQNGSILVEKLD